MSSTFKIILGVIVGVVLNFVLAITLYFFLDHLVPTYGSGSFLKEGSRLAIVTILLLVGLMFALFFSFRSVVPEFARGYLFGGPMGLLIAIVLYGLFLFLLIGDGPALLF